MPVQTGIFFMIRAVFLGIMVLGFSPCNGMSPAVGGQDDQQGNERMPVALTPSAQFLDTAFASGAFRRTDSTDTEDLMGSFSSEPDAHPAAASQPRQSSSLEHFVMNDYFAQIREAVRAVSPDAYPKAVVPYATFQDAIESSISENYWLMEAEPCWLDGKRPSRFTGQSFLQPDFEVGAHIQKVVVPTGARVILIGDLHGNIVGLHDVIKDLQTKGLIDTQLNVAQNTYIIFLGDLVDYGYCGADTLFTVLQLRRLNQYQVFICRGNHEQYGMFYSRFSKEIKARYTLDDHGEYAFNISMATLCSTFPFALFLQIEDAPEHGFALCCHGCLPDNPAALLLIKNFLEQHDVYCASIEDRVFFNSNKCSGFNWNDVDGRDALTLLERYPRVAATELAGVPDRQSRAERFAALFGDPQFQLRCEHCKTLTLTELIGLFQQTNTRLCLRGHQDMLNPIKFSQRGIGNPFYPYHEGHPLTNERYFTYYSSDEQEMIMDRLFQGYFNILAPASLAENGFTIDTYQNHFTVPLIATFSNAGSPRSLNQNGYGILEVGSTWEASCFKGVIIPAS